MTHVQKPLASFVGTLAFRCKLTKLLYSMQKKNKIKGSIQKWHVRSLMTTTWKIVAELSGLARM